MAWPTDASRVPGRRLAWTGVAILGMVAARIGQPPTNCAPAPEDEDLYDLAAVQAYLNGGNVYAVTADKMPGRDPLAAVFRY